MMTSWTCDTMLIPRDQDGDNSESVEVNLDSLLLDGQTIDIYQCERLLGRGGMGVVYLARNERLHRHCALKVLSPRRMAHDVDYVRRFETEGRAVAALVHPNVVTAHATGLHEEFHYLEMEYVPGQSLQKEIDTQGSIGPIRATQMAVGIAEGLSAAHRLGIIHRDLKPDNVLVTPAGQPKIADFGLAKLVVADSESRLVGTPHFMAPELFQGGEASTASDVFALGVCYYLMLTGKYPFEGDSLQSLMNSVMAGDYVGVRKHNSDIPLDMAECVALMLARSPDNRPRDGGAASQLLKAVLGAIRDLDTLVHEAFAHSSSITVEPNGNGFRVHLKLPGQRSQSVFLENSDHNAGERLLLIYSVCCEAQTEFYESALRLNSEVLHGGLSIRDIDGQPSFVMVDTFPRATVTSEAIRRSVIEVACRADHIEKLLTGKDVN